MSNINYIKKNNISNQLVYMAYACYLSCSAFIVNVLPDVSDILKILSLFLLLVSLLFVDRNLSTYIKIGLLVLAGLLYYIHFGYLQIFIIILFCVSAKNINMKQIVLLDFYVRSICILLTNIFCLTGLIEDITVIRYDATTAIIRHSLGYSHPNVAFLMVFVAIVDYLIINYLDNKLNVVKIFSTVGIAFIYQQVTDSRSGFVCLIIFMLLIVCEKKFHFTRLKIVRAVLMCLPVVLLLLSVLLVQMYSAGISFVYQIDQLLTGRIRSAYYFLNTYGVHLFGINTERLSTIDAIISGNRAYVLDNLYFNLIISYGAIFTIVFLLIYFKAIKALLKDSGEIYALVLSVFAILGLVEGAFLNIDFNFYIVCLNIGIYNRLFRAQRISYKNRIKNKALC